MNQKQAFEIFTLWYNLFLTGPAGSWKTYLVNQCVQYCKEHTISVAITASTGIAATHIGGITIHSWSGMWIRTRLNHDDIDDMLSKEYLMKRFLNTHVLIIDEISMLTGDFLASLDILLQTARMSSLPFWGMQIIFVGDFFQLPPVSSNSFIEYAFEHPSWSNFELVICSLSTQFRQWDDPLRNILSDIRSWNISEITLHQLSSRCIWIEDNDHTELFTKNISVDTYNIEKLHQIPSESLEFFMETKGPEKLVESLKKWCLAPEKLTLKIGTRVMFVKNNFESGYMNWTIGHVIWKSDGFPLVKLLDESIICAKRMSWLIEENGKIKASITQIPLRLAWAITIHKSQWMTLDEAVIDLSDAFIPWQGYVALSRVRTLNWLILRWFNTISLQIDQRVRDYITNFWNTSATLLQYICTLSSEEKLKQEQNNIVHLHGTIEVVSSDQWKKEVWIKIFSHEDTYKLLLEQNSISEIAEIRWLKSSTILSHIEKILDEKEDLDIGYLRPIDEEQLSTILSIFSELQTYSLSPVKQYLSEECDMNISYDEIRIARLFMKK